MSARRREELKRRAWSEYHAATRGLGGYEYDQTEPVAWLRLRRELALLNRHARRESDEAAFAPPDDPPAA